MRDVLTTASGQGEGAREARALLDRIDNAREEATLRQRDRVIESLLDYAQIKRVDPWSGNDRLLASWLFAAANKHTAQSIKQRAQIARDAYLRRGMPDPFLAPLVAKTLTTLVESSPKSRRSRDVLLVPDFRSVKAMMRSGSLTDLRDTIDLGLGFVGLLRPDSILRLSAPDISFQGSSVVIRSTYKRRPLEQRIHAAESDGLVEQLYEYIERSGIGEGPLIREIRNDKIVGSKAINKARFDQIFKQRLLYAGYDPTQFSWSSLIYGFLVSACRRGVDESALAKRAGYDTPERVRKIVAEIEAGTGAYTIASSPRREPDLTLPFESSF